MKIRPKKKKSTTPKKEIKPRSEGASTSLGSLDDLRDPNYLPDLRSKHREGGTLDLYCEMLETQIGSLVDKLLSIDYVNHSPDASQKALRELRTRVNAANNELNQAQIYMRDNYDKT